VAVCCDQRPTEPVEQPVATAPQFNFASGPEMEGVMSRYRAEIYVIDWFWETPDDPWMLWSGYAPGEVPSWCADEDRRPNGEIKTVKARQGENSNEIWKMDKVPVTVFDLAEHADYFYEGLDLGEDPYCYAVMNATPIGSGEGFYRSTERIEGWFGHFNGTVDYMGDSYRMQWKGEGEPFATLVARVF
jgi:hypothetical protein